MTGRWKLARTSLLAVGAALLVALAGPAQPPTPRDKTADDKRSKVPIQTADFVELEGSYYRGNKGRDTPCVMIVHKFNSDRMKSGVDELARALNAKGFAVLTFDLRGHGGSINVSPSFWQIPANRNGILRSNPRQTTISAANFKPSYFPWLVNDLVAARRFFEIKNDAGECNAQSIFVIGAGEGAALGMAFVASEWHRTYTVGVKALQSAGTMKIAGKDIAGAVWLSVTTRPNNINFPMRDWIRNTPMMREENPMCFIWGERDLRARTDGEELYRAITMGIGNREKLHKLDAKVELKATDLSGQALLGPQAAALGVPQKVITYVERVMAERKAIPWTDFEAASNPLTLVNLRLLGLPVP